jgi:Cytochrome P460/DDE domain
MVEGALRSVTRMPASGVWNLVAPTPSGFVRAALDPGTGGISDEVFHRINGKPQYLWRAVDQNGEVIDILVQPRRNKHAAKNELSALLTRAENGKPVPDGAKMAKVHWTPKQNEFFPDATVPGSLLNVDFMVKDSKRFADSDGWGWAVKPGTTAGTPPQGNDAKWGFACHTRAKARDYVFTEYGKR